MTRIALSPKYRLYTDGESEDEFTELSKSFAEGSGKGLLFLDRSTDAITEDPAFSF